MADGQEVLPSPVSTLATRQKPRVAVEAFPALSASAVKTTTSNNRMSLRLVDIPKEKKLDAQKRSG